MKMLQEAQEISIQVVRVLSYQVKHFGKEKGKAVLVLMWKIPILLNAEDRYITKRVIKITSMIVKVILLEMHRIGLTAYYARKKIQESCIFQIINKQRKNKGKMGYDMGTSELLSLSLFCITSKST